MRMPTPPRTLKTILERLRTERYQTTSTRRITREVVEAEVGSRYVVHGEVLPTTGIGGNIRAGDVVPVGWRQGRPVAILDHHERKAQFVPTGLPTGAVVEELFIAKTPAGSFDVFFRSREQVRPLRLTSFLRLAGSPPAPQETVQWGTDNSRFLLYESGTGAIGAAGSPVRVMKLNRKHKVAYRPGVSASAKQETSYDLSTISGLTDRGLVTSPSTAVVTFAKEVGFGAGVSVVTTLGYGVTSVTWHWIGVSPTGTGLQGNDTWSIFPAGDNPTYIGSPPTVSSAPNLGLPVAFSLNVTVTGGAGPPGSFEMVVTAFTPDLGFVRSNLVSFTASSGATITSTWTNPAGRPATNFQIFQQVVLAATWFTDNAFSQILLIVSSSPAQALLDERKHLLVAYRVTGNDTVNAKTLVSTMLVDVTARQTLYEPALQGTIPFSGTTAVRSKTLKFFDVKDGFPRSAVELTATLGNVFTAKFLAALQAGAAGTALGTLALANIAIPGTFPRIDANRRHAVWATATEVLMVAYDGVSGAITTPVVVGNGAADIAAFFVPAGGSPNEYRKLRLLNIDFLYNSFNGDDTLFFVRAWNYRDPAEITLVTPAALLAGDTTPSQRDGALREAGKLKRLPETLVDYPESPTGPTTIERFMAWQVVNDPEVLTPLGRRLSETLPP